MIGVVMLLLLLLGIGLALPRFLADEVQLDGRGEIEEIPTTTDQPVGRARRVEASPPGAEPGPLTGGALAGILDDERGVQAWRSLRLVDESGEAVADATIFILGARRLAAYHAERHAVVGFDVAEVTPILGQSDERGRFSYRPPEGRHLLIALKGELLAKMAGGPAPALGLTGASVSFEFSHVLFPGSEEMVLTMAAQDRIEVMVRERGGGARADVPVALGTRPGQLRDPFVAEQSWRETLLSPADGRLTFLLPRNQHGAIGVEGAFHPDPSAWVEDRHRAGETFELELPPHGAIMLRLVDPQGRPLTPDGQVKIGDPETPNRNRIGRLIGGRARLEPVALDRNFDLTIELEDQSRGHVAPTQVAGPTADEPLIDLSLTVTPEILRFRCRPIGPDGEGLPDRGFHFRFPAGRPSLTIRSDAEGILHGGFDPRGFRTPGKLDGELVLVDGGHDRARAPVEFDLPDLGTVVVPDLGLIDLGDLRLEQLPLLVSGRIVDEDGRGLAGIGPRVQPVDARRPSAGLRYGGFIGHGVVSDEDGRFEIRGVATKPDVLVTIGAPGRVGVDRTLPRGSAEAEFVLVRQARIRGRLLRTGPWADEALAIEVLDRDGRRLELGSCGPDGRFDLDLVPTSYLGLAATLHDPVAGDDLLDQARRQSLAGEFRVVPGEIMDLGELPIDLRARRIRFEFGGLDQARDKARLVIRDLESGLVCRRWDLVPGLQSLEVIVPRLPVEVMVEAEGLAREVHRVETSFVRLDLQPSSRVEVTVAEFRGLRHDQKATVVLTDEDGAGDQLTRIALDADGRGSAEIRSLGRHRVELRLHRLFGTWNEDYVTLFPVAGDTLDVVPGGGTAKLGISLAEGALADAVATLRGN